MGAEEAGLDDGVVVVDVGEGLRVEGAVIGEEMVAEGLAVSEDGVVGPAGAEAGAGGGVGARRRGAQVSEAADYLLEFH